MTGAPRPAATGRRRCGVLPLLVATALLGSASPVSATTPSPTPAAPVTEPVPDCWGLPLPSDEGGDGEPGGDSARDVECRFVEVPLDHADPHGEQIRLAVAVVQAESAAEAEPVLVLGGGPGQHTVELLTGLAASSPEAVVDRTQVDRDVVVVDQRGVGLSEPALECPEAGELEALSVGPQAPAAQDPIVQVFASCFERLSGTTDLSAFTTLQNVEDLEVLRRALVGEGQVALYGTSYGAKLALRAADVHPLSWSSVVLSSPLHGTANFVQDLAVNYEDTLARLAAACAADAAGCAVAFPDLVQRLDAAVARLQAEPEQVPSPVPGVDQTLPLDGVTLANLVFQLFYLPTDSVPAVVDGFSSGRAEAALASVTSPGPRADEEGPMLPEGQPAQDQGFFSGTSLGMQLSVLCAEELGYTDPERFAADAASASVTVQAFAAAPFFGFLTPALCEVWDVPLAPEAVFAPAQTETPVLLITGGLDQITPPVYGTRALAGLPNGVLVRAPDQGHAPGLGLGSCGAELVGRFLADPTGPLDVPCAEDRPVAFDTVLADVAAPLVFRVSGPDRYASASRLSAWTFEPGVETAFLVSGTDFPDGIAAGAGGAGVHAPVLLTAPGGLPVATAAELARLRPERVVVVGGSAAVADEVLIAAGLAADAPVERVDGADRYATAAALAREVFPEGTSTAYVATGAAFPDALTAGATAGAEGAALLLSGRDALAAPAADELVRLGVEEVVVVGGTAALDDAVVAQIEALGPSVTRVSGPDRYATAAALAERAGPGTGWAFVASGARFPDALAGAPVAAGRGPLLLVAPDSVPAATAAALEAADPSRIGVLGGPAAVGRGAAQSLGDFVEAPSGQAMPMP